MAELAILLRVNVERPHGLVGHHQREAGHGLGASAHLVRVDVQAGLFVGKNATALADGAHANAIGPGRVVGDALAWLARGHARGKIESALRLVVRVDHRRSAGYDLDGAVGDQAQRRLHTADVSQTDAIDRSADLI